MSDEQSTDAFERLYAETSPRLWRALIAFSSDPEVAEDAMAEAYAQALRRGDALNDPEAWVWRSAFRIASGELQRRRRNVPLAEHPMPDQSTPALVDLLAALRKLTPKQRLAIVLHDYADRPTDEVARTLGVTRGTVHVHLSQGRRRLRLEMEDRDD